MENNNSIERVELTCVTCPMGCALTVEKSGADIISIEGNMCPRGKQYAQAELTIPKRMLTTTMRHESGALLPVKTKEPILKGRQFDYMREINKVKLIGAVRLGDIVLENVLGLGVDIVACGNIS